MFYDKPSYLGMGRAGPSQEEIKQWEQEDLLNQIELLREMIYEQSIPDSLAKKLWGLVTKFGVLSNIQDVDERIFLREFDIVTDSAVNCMSTDEYTVELDNELNNLRVWFRFMLLRAKGPQRERIMQVMQINENINRQQALGGATQKKGLWNKLGSLLGKKEPIPQPATVPMPEAMGG